MNWFKHIARSGYNRWRFPKARIAWSASVSRDSVLEEGVSVLTGAQLGHCHVGRYTYICAGCRLARTDIGAFCSVGGEVMSGLATHPLTHVSTYPGFYTGKTEGATWFGSLQAFDDERPVVVGSDVWIGSRAILLGGVRIGHGAVIGAGTIVSKDVPDYAIVVGSPATIIRYRFEPGIIRRLLDSRWWETPASVLRELSPYFDRPEVLLEYLEKNSTREAIAT